ncbi:MAG: helix-turn-helix domain-containing protein [Candidatus Omnitrophota bacterium]
MTESQYISVREAAQILGVSERKIMDMIEADELKAYKIANQFLRLKKSEVTALQRSGTVENESVEYPYTIGDRIKDFFYFYDFYLISLVIMFLLINLVLNL